MNDWPENFGISLAITILIVFCIGLGMLIVKHETKSEWCQAQGGKMVDTTNGWACAKLEIIK